MEINLKEEGICQECRAPVHLDEYGESGYFCSLECALAWDKKYKEKVKEEKTGNSGKITQSSE